MTNLSNRVKDHAQRATNMSFGDIVKGSGRFVGNTIGLGFKAIGATIYVADKVSRAGLAVGRKAYDEAKEGYHQTDDLLSSTEEEPTRSHPVGSDAVDRRPKQMELDFE